MAIGIGNAGRDEKASGIKATLIALRAFRPNITGETFEPSV